MPPWRRSRQRRPSARQHHHADDARDQRTPQTHNNAPVRKPVHRPPPRRVPTTPALARLALPRFVPLALRHLVLPRRLSLRHAVRLTLGLPLDSTGLPLDSTVRDGARATLPVPENVALDGAPYNAGCGEGAARHDASVSHAGGCGAVTGQLLAAHSCASYTSYDVSRSCASRRS